MPAPFTNEAAISLWHLPNKLVGLCPTRRLNNFFFRRVRPAIGDVFANRGREQQRVLQHDGDLCPQTFLCDLANVAAIKSD